MTMAPRPNSATSPQSRQVPKGRLSAAAPRMTANTQGQYNSQVPIGRSNRISRRKGRTTDGARSTSEAATASAGLTLAGLFSVILRCD
jgi:hypothetical protein